MPEDDDLETLSDCEEEADANDIKKLQTGTNTVPRSLSRASGSGSGSNRRRSLMLGAHDPIPEDSISSF